MRKTSLIVEVVTNKMVPFILMYGIYIIFHGEVSPGGGFQGGVVIAAGLVLYAVVFGLNKGLQKTPINVLQLANTVGPFLFAFVGLWAIVCGYSFLANKVNHFSPHGVVGSLFGSITLLIINIGIGTTVSSIIVAIFYSFISFEKETKTEGVE